MRLLFIEDAADLAETMAAYLRQAGHAVDHAATRADAEAALRVAEHDVILLDLGLPDGSGLDLLRGLRKSGDRTPVVVATALDQISDRIAGLDAGADDYVVKPYHMAEVEARLRAASRRSDGLAMSEIELGDLIVDRARGRVLREGQEIRLTSREWAVLDALISARGRVLSRSALEEKLYAFDDEIEGNAVEVYISRLRGKIGREAIETRRGLGYCLP